VFLTFILSTSGTPKWYGHDFDKDNVLLYFPGQEQDYVIPRNTRSLGLTISKQQIRRLDWKLRPESIQRICHANLKAVVACCAQTTGQVKRHTAISQEDGLLLQERLSIQLSNILLPRLSEAENATPAELSASRAYRIVRSAEQHMATWDAEHLLDISQLARLVCVSPRTLYRAFHNQFGIGPYEYHVLMKLRAFRKSVRQQNLETDIITRTASNAGFSHMSRFSESYRKHYNEQPTETLVRWRNTHKA